MFWSAGRAASTTVLLDMTLDQGALVKRVEAGGPADLAGVGPDDVITAIDNQRVKDVHHLHEGIAHRKAGETVTLQIWRAGQTQTLTPALGEYR